MREIATDIAMRFLGRWYIWAGDDPTGFDCSGFVIEVLKSVGVLPRKGDWTAHQLMKRFESRKVDHPAEGCLVFWQNDNGRIRHVEYCLNSTLSIGASGGGASTTTADVAADQNAYIKVRPFSDRPYNRWGFVDPF